eukprot:CAMPEP_0194313070 /NCGR_PEP_ID=MMETSP0171-20130528/9968_1 /TAXON_ID=218684 /ORGANISM="Corethron pennatum, Strain L29A3" /LENGTH=323 /DNA_ID=CAMNT_0039067861 /DNA_START=333 /DNA_END=1305 /DNA_ORIENTATION=+
MRPSNPEVTNVTETAAAKPKAWERSEQDDVTACTVESEVIIPGPDFHFPSTKTIIGKEICEEGNILCRLGSPPVSGRLPSPKHSRSPSRRLRKTRESSEQCSSDWADRAVDVALPASPPSDRRTVDQQPPPHRLRIKSPGPMNDRKRRDAGRCGAQSERTITYVRKGSRHERQRGPSPHREQPRRLSEAKEALCVLRSRDREYILASETALRGAGRMVSLPPTLVRSPRRDRASKKASPFRQQLTSVCQGDGIVVAKDWVDTVSQKAVSQRRKDHLTRKNLNFFKKSEIRNLHACTTDKDVNLLNVNGGYTFPLIANSDDEPN